MYPIKTYRCDFFEDGEKTSLFSANLSRIPSIDEIITFQTDTMDFLSFQVQKVRYLFQKAIRQNISYALRETDLSYEILVRRITNMTLQTSQIKE